MAIVGKGIGKDTVPMIRDLDREDGKPAAEAALTRGGVHAPPAVGRIPPRPAPEHRH